MLSPHHTLSLRPEVYVNVRSIVCTGGLLLSMHFIRVSLVVAIAAVLVIGSNQEILSIGCQLHILFDFAGATWPYRFRCFVQKSIPDCKTVLVILSCRKVIMRLPCCCIGDSQCRYNNSLLQNYGVPSVLYMYHAS